MEKNKMIYLRRLFFIITFSIFGLVNLFAESDGGTDVKEPIQASENDFVSADKFDDTISGIKNDIENLRESLQKNTSDYNILLDKISELPIWQIIPAIAETLIAAFILGVLVLLLLILLVLKKTIHDAPKTGIDEMKRKELPVNAESKSAAPDVLPAEFNTLKDKLDDIQPQLRRLTDRTDSQSKEASRFESNLTSFRAEMEDNKQKIRDIEAAVSSLKTAINKDMEKRARKEETERDPVAAFNKWAQNPRLPLPLYFTYVTILKLEFRTKQEFTDTNTETEWIRNTIGERRYIFPNPNKIDNLAGPVDKLYKVAGARKAPGTNSVKITSACQIKEGNFIEYQGELTLM